MIVQSGSTVNHSESVSTSNVKFKISLEILHDISFLLFHHNLHVCLSHLFILARHLLQKSLPWGHTLGMQTSSAPLSSCKSPLLQAKLYENIRLPSSCSLKVTNSRGCTATSPMNVFSWFHNIRMLFSSTLDLVSHFTRILLSSNTDLLCIHVNPQARRAWILRGEPYSLLNRAPIFCWNDF